MATIDVAGGTSGHLPSSTGRKQAMVLERTVDFAKVTEKKGSDLASSDVVNVFNLPAGSYLLAGGAEVEEAETNASATTVDVGTGGGDTIVDGADVTSTGFKASGTNGSRELNTTGAFQASDATVTMKIASATGVPANAKVRVYLLVADVNGR